METLVRKAQPADFEEVHSLIKAFAHFIGTPETVRITTEQMRRDKDHFHCFIAEDRGRIIGFATYFIAYYSWTGKAVYLDDLYVLEDHRGQGIGTTLFDAVKQEGQALDCVKMRWQVSNWNHKARAFYESKGAQIDEVEINCDLVLT